MKNIFFTLTLLIISHYTFAKPIEFIPQTISSEDKLLNGNILLIKNKEFETVNNQILNDLLKDYDLIRVDFSSKVLFQNNEYLTLQVHKEIQGGRSYSREQYYVIDLKQKKLLNLYDVLKRYAITATEIENHIFKQLKNVFPTELSYEYFDEYLLTKLAISYNENPEFINLTKDQQFYLNNNILGISFDIHEASYAFEFKIENDKIQLKR